VLASSLKTGTIFKEDNAPWLVEKYEHTKTARGGATVKVMARNLLTDQVLEKRYQSNSKVEDADVLRKNIQYLYRDGDSYFFMDPDSFEQMRLTKQRVGESAKFLLEGELVQVMYFEGQAVSIELPNSMIFEVVQTTPGYRGNTVNNVYKDAELNNGTRVKVPSHIKEGERVKIDTRTGEYVSKA
jgi:elongation factor P